MLGIERGQLHLQGRRCASDRRLVTGRNHDPEYIDIAPMHLDVPYRSHSLYILGRMALKPRPTGLASPDSQNVRLLGDDCNHSAIMF